MNAQNLTRTAAALLGLSALASPAVADLMTIAEVGAPAGGGEHYVAVLLRDTDGGLPAPGHTLFLEGGAGFASVAQLVPTTNTTALRFILARAAAAGLDNAALETALDAVAGAPAPDGTSLADKLSYVLRGEPSDNDRDATKALLAGVFPQVAMACGAGWIGKVPAAVPAVFELRDTPSGRVLGRVTAGTAPQPLPAPGGVNEVPAPDPTGHLRIHLNWWVTPALRDRTPHVSGYHVFRADRAAYIAETGSPPPLKPTPAEFAAALGAGLIVKVNACPVVPDALFEAQPPADAPHFFIDDNDTAALSRFDEGGAPFADGQELTFYVAACDPFGRPGTPSAGLETKACDRMPPGAPELLRAEQVRRDGETYVRLTWRKDPEVGRYFVYCYDEPGEALPDLRHENAPETPAMVGVVIPEVGDEVLVSFVHDGPGRLQLPGDAGETRWYCVRAEDTASCIDADGFGNISPPCGTVPASLYGFDALGAPVGYLLTRCCDLLVSLQSPPAPIIDGTPLRATRNDPRIRWVEFREAVSGTSFGQHEFGAANSVQIAVDVSHLPPPVQFSARFGLSNGYVGEWFDAPPRTAQPPQGESWRALLRCGGLEYSPDCESFPLFPFDPATGATEPVCGEFVQQPGEHSWRVFRRIGQTGEMSLVASGRFEDTDTWCDPAVPSHLPTTLCYYGQTFDQDGNPSSTALLGCRHVADGDRLPKPDITGAEVQPGGSALDPTATARIAWFCPRPGVERFDLAIFPVPPGVAETVVLSGIEWGVLRSPRLPSGFGGDGTAFALDLQIAKGTNYVARVRARGLAPAAHPQMMAAGPWSAPENILWTPPASSQPGVLPWPSRPVPGVADAAWPAGLDFEDKGRVAIGAIPAAKILLVTTLGAEVQAESITPFLFKPLPLAVYRHETTPGARGEMLQTSPLIEPFWQPWAPGVLLVGSAFVNIAQLDGAKPADPYYIWVRDHHPLTLDSSYRYTVTCFGGDGEITVSLTSAEFTAQ